MAAMDEKIAAEEAAPMTADERQWYDMTLQAVPEEQRKAFASQPTDVLCIVRGFSGAKHRKEETLKSVTSIAEWRQKVNYYNIFANQLPMFAQFHDSWKESICGPDSMGHMIQVIRIGDIDVDAIEKMDEKHLEMLQGQKMKAYAVYKDDLARSRGVQRYKHTLIIDLTQVKMSMVSTSARRHTMSHIFGIGSKYFPETIWKIYLINGPMIFRGIFSLIKPILAPETIAKIIMLGSYEKSLKQMEADGVPRAVLPDWMGGGTRPTPTAEYISQLVMQRRTHSPQMNPVDRRGTGLPVMGDGLQQQMQGMTLMPGGGGGSR